MQQSFAGKKQISIVTAIIIWVIFAVVIAVTGVTIGNKYFYQQYKVTPFMEVRLRQAVDLLQKNPQDPLAYLATGYQYLGRGEKEYAMQEFRRAHALDPENPAVLLNMGLLAISGKQPEEAKKYLGRLLEKNPYNYVGLVNLGVLYAEEGRPLAALEMLNRALEIKRGAADVYLLRAAIYEKLGDLPKARQDVEQALRFIPDWAEARAQKIRLDGKGR